MTMDVDHRGRETNPPKFGVGDANASCFPGFMDTKKGAFCGHKIRQTPFSARALPTPLPILHLTRHQPILIRRSLCVPPKFQPDLRPMPMTAFCILQYEGSAFFSKQGIETVTRGNDAKLYKTRVYSARGGNYFSNRVRSLELITQPYCRGIFRWCF